MELAEEVVFDVVWIGAIAAIRLLFAALAALAPMPLAEKLMVWSRDPNPWEAPVVAVLSVAELVV